MFKGLLSLPVLLGLFLQERKEKAAYFLEIQQQREIHLKGQTLIP